MVDVTKEQKEWMIEKGYIKADANNYEVYRVFELHRNEWWNRDKDEGKSDKSPEDQLKEAEEELKKYLNEEYEAYKNECESRNEAPKEFGTWETDMQQTYREKDDYKQLKEKVDTLKQQVGSKSAMVGAKTAEVDTKTTEDNTKTEDKQKLTKNDLMYKMAGLSNILEFEQYDKKDAWDKNIEDAIKTIEAFANGDIDLDPDAIGTMDSFIKTYMVGNDGSTNPEKAELRAKALEKLNSMKKQAQQKDPEQKVDNVNTNTQEEQGSADNSEEQNAVTEDIEVVVPKDNKDNNEEKTGENETTEDEDQELEAEEQRLKELEEASEKDVETPEESKAFDEEYDTVSTEEQLERNAKVMDDMAGFDPFELDKEGNLVHKEFQDEYDVFKNIKYTNSKSKELSEKLQNKLKETMIETAIFEADVLTRGTASGSDEDIKKAYKENLHNSIQKEIVSTVFASRVKENKKLSKEDISEAFMRATNIAKTETRLLRVEKSAVTAYASIVYEEMTKLRDHLKKKFTEIPAVKSISDKLDAFDKKMGKKHSKAWNIAKRYGKVVAKSVGRTAVYAAVGYFAGPIGLSVLAAKGAYDACNNISKQAKNENLTFWGYVKKHPWQTTLSFATTGLALVSAGMGAGVFGQETAQAVSPYLKPAMRTLALAPKGLTTGWHGLLAGVHSIRAGYYKIRGKTEKASAAWEKTKKEWAETKTAAGRFTEAAVGIWAGSTAYEAINQPEPTESTPRPMVDKDGDNISDYIDADGGEGWANDADNDGIKDINDIDHGQGWATANETQIDRAFDADAKGINEALKELNPDHKWMSSNDLHKMMESGGFTEEQLKAIHQHAESHFDEKGNIIDDKLEKYYEEKAAEQKAAEMREKFGNQPSSESDKTGLKAPSSEDALNKSINNAMNQMKDTKIEFSELNVDYNGDGRYDEVTVRNEGENKVTIAETKGGRVSDEVVIQKDGKIYVINEENLKDEAGDRNLVARRHMRGFVDDAKDGKFDNMSIDEVSKIPGAAERTIVNVHGTYEDKLTLPDGSTQIKLYSPSGEWDSTTIETIGEDGRIHQEVTELTGQGEYKASVDMSADRQTGTRDIYDSDGNHIRTDTMENGNWKPVELNNQSNTLDAQNDQPQAQDVQNDQPQAQGDQDSKGASTSEGNSEVKTTDEGSKSVKTEYGDNGAKTETATEYGADGKPTSITETTYDKNGKISTISVDGNANGTSEKLVEYQKGGKYTETYYNDEENGGKIVEVNYDKDGNATSMTEVGDDNKEVKTKDQDAIKARLEELSGRREPTASQASHDNDSANGPNAQTSVKVADKNTGR